MAAVHCNVKDLQELSGDVLLFGGPYSNLQASEAMLDQARVRGIPASNRVCTGDVIAYCGNPVATLELWRNECWIVAGNCEKQIGLAADDCGCGFDSGSACDVLSRTWYTHANREVSDGDRAFMARCPDLIVFSQMGKRYSVVHGGVSDIARFLWPGSADIEFQQEIDLLRNIVGDIDCVIAGHCGVPFEKHINGVDWVNVGAIGMPPNDGHAATRFGVLYDGAVQIEKLEYDISAARRAMEVAGLNLGYEIALTTGYWPSEDILPPELRRQESLANG